MKLLIIIPAYNEEDSLPFVAADLGDLIKDSVVINDGSRDNTGDIARNLGFRVIDLPFNIGIGGSVQTGLKYASDNDYHVAVQFDGDFQHRADQIENILEPVKRGEADLVIGSRVLAKGYRFPFLRRLGGKWFSFLLYLLSGVRVTDPTSGFRCYGRKAIEYFSKNYPEDYPEVESVLMGSKIGLRIQEVPAFMRARTKGRSSIGAFKAVYYMIKVTLGILIGSLRAFKK